MIRGTILGSLKLQVLAFIGSESICCDTDSYRPSEIRAMDNGYIVQVVSKTRKMIFWTLLFLSSSARREETMGVMVGCNEGCSVVAQNLTIRRWT